MAGLAARAISPLLLVLLLVWTFPAAVDNSSLSSLWQQELPSTGIPEEFEKLASPLSATRTQLIVSKIRAGSFQQESHVSKDFCTSSSIYCPQKDTVVVPVSSPQPRVCIPPFFHYEYGVIPCGAAGATAVSAVQASAVFMPQEALIVGKKVQLPDTSNDLQGLKFLPSSIVDVLPKLEPDSLPELAKFYGVKKGSDMELEMENTLAHCGFKSEHEVKACQASGEGVVSFVSRVAGRNVDAVTAPALAKQEAMIMDVSFMSRQGKKTIACHNMKFPSLVYSCHMSHTAELMAVTLKLANGHLAHLPAVCHMDTSYWNPSHVAFQALNVQPGKSSVCHWFPENTFIFVQKTDS
ncbi:hypothetical protein GOP47_0024265 [Adiantum capillus-veneris]|uniref:BURP domain-containing protein n=1 Tax=Adiantum capillus-veneris TaxID=13818 RepID=A0A9D4U4S2_ADICA|nr:hypothetical protein GOP47_0023973 [Adiantum capillus-veneris]KAI5061760.1 hypothetical protein GOP47_0024265 [Adiantum capillus-veneris]